MRCSLHVLLGLAGLAVVGCASVESTAVYYTPYSTETYPPKEKDAVIPIVGKPPTEPHQAIGELKFSSNRSYRWLKKSIEYNARRVGADLVYMRESSSEPAPYSYYVPPRTRWIPVGGYTTVKKKDGERVVRGYRRTIPVWEPGYTVQGMDIITSIDAEMIVLKNSNR